MSTAPSPASRFTFDVCRAAQHPWAMVPVRERLRCVRRFPHSLARDAAEVSMLVAAVRSTSKREALTSEVIPLLSACKFLERDAERILRTHKAPGAAPLWLRGVDVDVTRDPFGVVL